MSICVNEEGEFEYACHLLMIDVFYLQVCPVCAVRVGFDMVAHITLQHGNIFKISFLPYVTICINGFCFLYSYVLDNMHCVLWKLTYYSMTFIEVDYFEAFGSSILGRLTCSSWFSFGKPYPIRATCFLSILDIKII